MLGDFNENLRSVGVAKMLARRKQVAEESANNDECPHALSSSLIRLFDLPLLNLEANVYYEIANSDFYQEKLSAIANLTDTKIQECLEKPEVLHYLNVIALSQSVERHMKLVAEAFAQVERVD